MGRPRKPTSLKILDGDRADRINPAEPTAQPGLGDPPTWLDRFGRDAWEQFKAHHKMSRLLTILDAEMVTLYCQSYSTYRHALAKITEELASQAVCPATAKSSPDDDDDDVEGCGDEHAPEFSKPHPYFKVVAESHRQMTRILSKFGMTPSDRAGLHIQATPEDDQLLKLMATKNGKNGGQR